MQYKYFLIENIEGLRKIIINNPKKRNAMNRDAYNEWAHAINAAASDESVKVLAITGFGDFYSSGNDLSFSMAANENLEDAAKEGNIAVGNVIRSFIQFPKLLIAVVNGPCIGIAATTAILCDIVYATDNAYFLTPFTSLGLCAEGCSSFTFPRVMGKSKASEMLFLNHKMDAAEALRYRVVSDVVKLNDLDTIIWPRLMEFTKLPIGSMCATKRLLKAADVDNLEAAFKREMLELEARYSSEELFNAVMNFMTRKGSKL